MEDGKPQRHVTEVDVGVDEEEGGGMEGKEEDEEGVHFFKISN